MSTKCLEMVLNCNLSVNLLIAHEIHGLKSCEPQNFSKKGSCQIHFDPPSKYICTTQSFVWSQSFSHRDILKVLLSFIVLPALFSFSFVLFMLVYNQKQKKYKNSNKIRDQIKKNMCIWLSSRRRQYNLLVGILVHN